MRYSDQEVGLFLDGLYDAALHPELWTGVCDKLATLTGGVGAVLIPRSPELRALGMRQSDSLRESSEVYLRDGWYLRDERDRGIRRVDRMSVVFEQDVVTIEEIGRSPYYQEFLRPCGLKWFAGLGFDEQGQKWAASIQRTAEQGMFGENDRRALAQLPSHFSRAAEMAMALGYAEAEGFINAFQRMFVGAAALDYAGRVVMTNPAADGLLGDGLTIRNARLTAAEPNGADRLGGLILASITRRAILSERTLVTIAIPRPSGKRALQLMACPLGSRSISEFSPIRSIILIVDPEQKRVPISQVLVQQFGLTVSEGRLARRLAAGEPLAAAAASLHLTEESARTYLKSLLSKTSTHKQSELVALLASLAILPGE
jgi:DNA-binding CsgD family transcriptional regulator